MGELDPSNPGSIRADELDAWSKHGHVEVLGPRSDIPDLMSQSRVVVLPSYREGLPKVLIEAAACGRAVVATDVPGCRDAIVPGVTGLLVPPKNVEALAKAIKLLVDDPKTCEELGQAGRIYAEENFDIRGVVNTHLKIYKELADSRC